jgi:hypothetical protein
MTKETKEQYVKIRKKDIDFIINQLELIKNEAKGKRKGEVSA